MHVVLHMITHTIYGAMLLILQRRQTLSGNKMGNMLHWDYMINE